MVRACRRKTSSLRVSLTIIHRLFNRRPYGNKCCLSCPVNCGFHYYILNCFRLWWIWTYSISIIMGRYSRIFWRYWFNMRAPTTVHTDMSYRFRWNWWRRALCYPGYSLDFTIGVFTLIIIDWSIWFPWRFLYIIWCLIFMLRKIRTCCSYRWCTSSISTILSRMMKSLWGTFLKYCK